MVAVKVSPTGVDRPIQQLQQYLHDYVLSAFGLADADYSCYGRAYRNQLKDNSGYVPEVYVGGNEYRDAFYDDKRAIVSFFTVDDEIGFSLAGGYNTTDVGLIFSVNLKKLYPNVLHRADEECRRAIGAFFNGNMFGFDFTGVTTGIDNVFQEYDGYRNEQNRRFDMHPAHCFRIDLTLTYDKNSCFTPLFAQSN